MDGVLRFKNKWGMSMLNPTTKGFMLKPLCKSEGAMSFLVNNPFIHLESDKYVGIVFAEDSPITDGCRDIYSPYRSCGLMKSKIYTDNGHEENSVIPGGKEDSVNYALTDTLF